jgi:pre-mRNA cleavage complex 2 protein Pcf11
MSMPAAHEVAADFRDALHDLRTNSRPEISNLTLIAKENTEYAQAISTELEQHIRSTRPEFKLPALYVLDSIVKNVGTPYTVYLGRNMYKTFMDAYLAMDQGTRKAMEGLLVTWKQPVPESMDPRPVFPADVTGDIEQTLAKMRSAIQQQQLSRQPHALPARPPTSVPWRDTPTPPQAHNIPRYVAPNDPRARPGFPQAPQYALPLHGQPVPQSATPLPPSMGSLDWMRTAFPPAAPSPAPAPAELKAEVTQLVHATQARLAINYTDVSLSKTLDALRGLKHILDTQLLPPQQLEAVRLQIKSLAPPPTPPPAHGGWPAPAPYTAAPAPYSTTTAPYSATPVPYPAAPTPYIAPAPYVAPQQFPPPSSTPAPSIAMSTTNLAQLLAQFNTPAPASTTPAVGSVAQMLAQFTAPAVNAPPAIGSAEWLRKSLSAQGTQHRLSLVARLYEAKSNMCATCGRRFDVTVEGKEKKARHMDWHFKVKDPEARKRAFHRSWYVGEKEWIDYKEVDETATFDQKAASGATKPKKQAKDRYVSVPQDPTLQHAPCAICQEKFETQWNVDANDFVWMDAVQVGGKVYHATCYEEAAGVPMPSTPDSVLGKRKAEIGGEMEGKKIRAN